MPRQAAIIRFWFVALAVALLGLWEPALWFGVVPLFFFPNCACCPSCVCSNCDGGFGPNQYQVVTTGFSSAAPGPPLFPCQFCESLNATWILDCDAVECIWSYNFSAICVQNRMEVRWATSGSNYQLRVQLNNFAWVKTYGTTKENCSAISGESVPFLSNATSCLYDGSACTVTAL